MSKTASSGLCSPCAEPSPRRHINFAPVCCVTVTTPGLISPRINIQQKDGAECRSTCSLQTGIERMARARQRSVWCEPYALTRSVSAALNRGVIGAVPEPSFRCTCEAQSSLVLMPQRMQLELKRTCRNLQAMTAQRLQGRHAHARYTEPTEQGSMY